ncbi:MAG: hypothetical protein VKS61_17025 [Candidatus Sericytochromatia bacterium]|nr:hypothetical protein [Candidatus Sericytochromatia bacterium]
MAKRLPTYFIPHGGGPWPYMKAETGGMFDRLEASLEAIARELGESAPVSRVESAPHPRPPVAAPWR